MPTPENRKKPNRPQRGVISLLAALPLVLLQLLFLSDIDGWINYLGEGQFLIIYPAVFLGWAILLWIEWLIRWKLLPESYQTPWFTIVGLVFLITFFQFATWVNPLVLQFPQLCISRQTVVWGTSQPNTKYGSTNAYFLALTGRGNKSNHQFESAYLSWSGDSPAGFSNINISTLTFSDCSGCNPVSHPLTLSVLQERMMNSGLPSESINRISKDIWKALNLARSNQSIETDHGAIDAIETTPWGNKGIISGASIWIFLLLGIFQWVGRLSIPKESN